MCFPSQLMDKGGNTTSHRAPTAHSPCQAAAFSFPSQRSHNTSSKTKAETSELASVQIQTFLSKHLNENHDSLSESAHTTWAGTRGGRLQTSNSPLTSWKHFPFFLFFEGEKKFQIIECPYCLLNSWLQLSQNSCLIVSDKLFSNSHLFLVKLAGLSLSVMLCHRSNPDPL